MASYIESSLGRSERIVYKAQVSWLSQFWGIVFGILLLMWVIGIVLIETFAKKPFPQQPKPKHSFSAVFVSNIH